MKLRGQLLLAACGTAFVFGGLGMSLVARRAKQVGNLLLDGELSIANAGWRRQWALRRDERQSVYEAAAAQPYFRAYLLANDRAQMEYFAGSFRKKGADLVAILDAEQRPLALDGAGSEALVKIAGDPMGQIVAIGGKLANVYRVRIGGDSAVGSLVAANWIDAAALNVVEQFQMDAALSVHGVVVSTFPVSTSVVVSRLLAEMRPPDEVAIGGEGFRLRTTALGEAKLLLAVPTARVGALTSQAARLGFALLGLVLAVACAGVVLVMRRLTGPLERLQVAAELLGRGDFGAGSLLPVSDMARRDEIGVLVTAFMGAAEQLADLSRVSDRLLQDFAGTMAEVDTSAAQLVETSFEQDRRLREIGERLRPVVESFDGARDQRQAVVTNLVSLVTSIERIAGEAKAASTRATTVLLYGLERLRTDPSPAATVATRLLNEVLLHVDMAVTTDKEQLPVFLRVNEQLSALTRMLQESAAASAHKRERVTAARQAVLELADGAQAQRLMAGTWQSHDSKLRRAVLELRRLLRSRAPVDEAPLATTPRGTAESARPV